MSADEHDDAWTLDGWDWDDGGVGGEDWGLGSSGRADIGDPLDGEGLAREALAREAAETAPEVIDAGFLSRDGSVPGPSSLAAGPAAGFTSGDVLDTMRPCVALVGFADDATGPDGRCDGATDDQLIGVLRAWDRIESWAGERKLAVIAELIRRRPAPGCQPAGPGAIPTAWGKFCGDELAAATATSGQAAEKALTLAYDLASRLRGTARALRDGAIDVYKARIIADVTRVLDPPDAAAAEALVLHDVASKTPGQLRVAIARAVAAVNPGAAQARREKAQRDARVELWREDAGTAALCGRDLPPAEALAADQRITAYARELKAAGLEGTLDRLRARAFLDLALGVRSHPASPRDVSDPAARQETGGAPGRGNTGEGGTGEGGTGEGGTGEGGTGEGGTGEGGTGEGGTGEGGTGEGGTGEGGTGEGGTGEGGTGEGGTGEGGTGEGGTGEGGTGEGGTGEGGTGEGGTGEGGTGEGGTGEGGTGEGGTGEGGTGEGGTGEGGTGEGDLSAGGGDPGEARTGGLGPDRPGFGGQDSSTTDSFAGIAARINLTIPLTTLLGRAERPGGKAGGLGAIDPALARTLAGSAARNPRTTWCVTVTDEHGHPAAHGCARTARSRPPAGASSPDRGSPPAGGGPGDRGGTAFTREHGNGPPGGYGRWRLRPGGGRELLVGIEPLAITDCDHRHESAGYEPSDTLRHLVQVRDGECTWPPCRRAARRCDFEHAVPWDQGGRTCACNAGSRCRHHHHMKQAHGWRLEQDLPGYHTWTTPAGRTYTTGPAQYAV